MLNSVMTDWGSEFNGAFAVYCRENKIQMHKSCPYQPTQKSEIKYVDVSAVHYMDESAIGMYPMWASA